MLQIKNYNNKRIQRVSKMEVYGLSACCSEISTGMNKEQRTAIKDASGLLCFETGTGHLTWALMIMMMMMMTKIFREQIMI